MERPHIRFRLPDGSHTDLGHGDLIGRMWNAALHIDDARVSEAHAMVSLRGGELRLLALRGRFAVDQQPLSDVTLSPGMEILLARGLSLVVEAVVLPDRVLAVEGDGLPRQHLVGVCSLFASDPPRMVSRYAGDADAWIWNTGRGWRLRTGEDEGVVLEAGASWTLAGKAFRAVAVPLEQSGPNRTRALGAVQPPLKLVAFYDTLHIHAEGRPTVQLRGQGARILSELVLCGAPVSWLEIAGQLWPAEVEDSAGLRRKWDIALARLRRQLRDADLRPDLLRSDGSGLVELFLYDGDHVEDRT